MPRTANFRSGSDEKTDPKPTGRTLVSEAEDSTEAGDGTAEAGSDLPKGGKTTGTREWSPQED